MLWEVVCSPGPYFQGGAVRETFSAPGPCDASKDPGLSTPDTFPLEN